MRMLKAFAIGFWRVLLTCWEGVKAGVLWLLPAVWIVAATASIVFLVGKLAEAALEKGC